MAEGQASAIGAATRGAEGVAIAWIAGIAGIAAITGIVARA